MVAGPGKITDTHNRHKIASNGWDPTGLFDAGAIPSITDAAELIHGYVEGKAQELGKTIPRNRGLPHSADPKNMLSLEEKAIVILGRSVGVVWTEIRDRICALRVARGEEPPDRDFYSFTVKFVKNNKEIVSAIQADLLEATEAFSPLVGGTQRFLWRARVLEWYRQRFISVSLDEDLAPKDRDAQLRLIDSSMRPHMDFLDKVGGMGDMSKMLASPSERVREQAQSAAEAQLAAQRESGEVTEEEYIDRLRLLRFGQE